MSITLNETKLSTDELLLKTDNEKIAKFPWWNKHTLTIEETAIYFGFGEKALRRFIAENKDQNFIIQNGVKILIKRKLFEHFVDEKMSAL